MHARTEAIVKRALAAVAVIVFLPLASCDDDDDDFGPGALGAWCRDDFDCPSRCVEGLCTFSCANDRECPPGYACADPHGGVCMEVCSPNGCGYDYHCAPAKRHGAGGEVLVCRG